METLSVLAAVGLVLAGWPLGDFAYRRRHHRLLKKHRASSANASLESAPISAGYPISGQVISLTSLSTANEASLQPVIQLALRHRQITAFSLPAMTTLFHLDPCLVEDLEPGQHVTAQLAKLGQRLILTNIVPVTQNLQPSVPPAASAD